MDILILHFQRFYHESLYTKLDSNGRQSLIKCNKVKDTLPSIK